VKWTAGVSVVEVAIALIVLAVAAALSGPTPAF